MLVSCDPPEKIDYATFAQICRTYGSKAAGLALLPLAWRPDFRAISVELHRIWSSGASLIGSEELNQVQGWMAERSLERFIVRSSGVNESIQDRGKFQSKPLPKNYTAHQLADAIAEIFQHAKQTDSDELVGIVVQIFKEPAFSGHLSNEYRVSPTKNQWSYELDRPDWNPAKGINSKFTTAPDPSDLLRCGNRVPHQHLRSVAHYLADRFKERCHVEWIVSNGTLWLVQIDLEWSERDEGFDPKNDLHVKSPLSLNLGYPGQLTAYSIGSATEWPKLRNLSEFDFDEQNPGPRIYPLAPQLILEGASDAHLLASLTAEIVALTGDRLVVRTDCIQGGIEGFNLPRTDTVSAARALEWCAEVIDKFVAKNIPLDKYTFLFHAFLPARASAWAYSQPGNPIVLVDALWGLPDGMQVLPVDTYEVNVSLATVVKTKSTYKPKFLTELDDGSWDYQSIRSRSARSNVLATPDKVEIAKRTRSIADKLDANAQIMWFCGVPEAYGVGRNIPWFRSREVFDPAPRQQEKLRPFVINNQADLERLPPGRVTLKLSPEASLIRDEGFIDRVIQVAKIRSLPIELDGSILGHTYYKLSQEQIPVILSNEPKYYRKRRKQVFGKIVRDKIPANIAAGGEAVREAKLAREDLRLGLSGKLLEELEELIRARSHEERTAELADVLEVLRGLAGSLSLDWNDIEEASQRKREKRGGFVDGRVLIETSLPRRNNPLDTEELVSLGDLGKVEVKETQVEIPVTSLIATVCGPGFIFSFLGDPMRYRLALRDGTVRVTKLDRGQLTSNAKQTEMFELFETWDGEKKPDGKK